MKRKKITPRIQPATKPTQMVMCRVNTPEEQWIIISHLADLLWAAADKEDANKCLQLLERLTFLVKEVK